MNRSPVHPAAEVLLSALTLALGAAIALGLARFAYALLLPAMHADLGWSYFTAGAMNTANAAGYLAGALVAPWLIRRVAARGALIGGGTAAAAALALHGLSSNDAALYTLRFFSGVASAAIFVSGGLLAARLAARPGLDGRITPSLVIGIYYGGTGLGVVASALIVPPWLAASGTIAGRAPWQWAWVALGAAALVATIAMAMRPGATASPAAPRAAHGRVRLSRFGFGLAAYLMFGVGYIGYMTFSVTLLREQQMPPGTIAAFFALLGVAMMISPWLWAGLLQRCKGGAALSLLCGVLAVATALPVLVPSTAIAFVSGVLFGAVILSVVASTTALVRHNLPESEWPAGISVFTIMFAAGQIIGPSLVGRLSDGAGGLRAGFAVSAAILAGGAVLGLFQRPLRD